MKYVVRVLLFVTLLFHSVYADKINQQKIEYSENVENESFYFIGCNDKKFAYIKHIFKEGVGDYYWQINIQDFETQKTRVEGEFLSSGLNEKKMPQLVLDRVERLIVDQSLSTPHISLSSFPKTVSHDIFDVDFKMKSEQKSDGVTVQTKSLRVTKNDKFIKNIGEVNSLVFFGHKKYFAFKVVGFLHCSNHMLVLVSFKRQEDKESRIMSSFKLFSTEILK